MAHPKPTQQLLNAIKDNDIEQVTAALDADAAADSAADSADTPVAVTALGHAARYGRVEIAALLLDRGAHVDAADRRGLTALQWACGTGHMDVAELLASRDASIDLADAHGRTALVGALFEGKHELATWLLDHDARVDVVTEEGLTVLHCATWSGYPDLARLLQDPAVAAMVDAQEDTPHDTDKGKTALYIAAHKGCREHARLLLDAGADVDIATVQQRTPLHMACQEGKLEVMRELLYRGAGVNAADERGHTPLMLAVRSMRYSPLLLMAVRLLLEYGADRSLQDDGGRTARALAVEAGEDEVINVLDTYFPVTLQMEQVLLGMRGPAESPLTRFVSHSAFEPNVLWIVAALHSGKPSGAFTELQQAASS